MLNNYNLFNKEKVDELTSTFLEIGNYHTDIVEKFILELINYYELNDLCKNISFSCSNSFYLGMYSERDKQLFINYKKIIETFNKVSVDNYFIKSNLYRIVLHEIKHILQHKMVNNCDSELCQLFQYEFSNGCDCVFPSEINADIESLLVILNNYDKSHTSYDKLLTFSLNLINSFYEPECIVGNFCKNNKIQIVNIDMMNKFLYGLDDRFVKVKKFK